MSATHRSPFVAILPGGVPMAFPIAYTLGNVIVATAVCAENERADIQIVRDEDGVRTPLGTVHPDGSWEES